MMVCEMLEGMFHITGLPRSLQLFTHTPVVKKRYVMFVSFDFLELWTFQH